MSSPRVLAVIPARIGSTRLARKPLALLSGKPLVQWVFEAASRARGVGEVIVATDSEEVAAAVRAFGGRAAMTGDHPSGTDRVAEVARSRPDADVIVNVQGDEPLLPPEYLDAGIAPFREPNPPRIATLIARSTDAAAFADPGVAKVVADRAGNALYFSRAAIPHGAASWLRHVGVYFFARAALFEFVALPPSSLERAERLEQLRALENGIPIRLVEVAEPTLHVDTPEDLATVESFLRGR